MKKKLDIDAFHAQFHNHDHYKPHEEHESRREYWELPETGKSVFKRGGSVYDRVKRVVSTAGRYSRGGESDKTDERSVVDRALQLTSKGYRK